MRLLLPFLLLWGFSVYANENLITEGNFEVPFVKGRTPADHGGDPTDNGKSHGWIAFEVAKSGSSGVITGGLTDEIARGGKQCLYIKFNHVNSVQSATLISNFIPVVSGTEYQVGIFGRTDAKDLVDSQGRSAYLKLQVDFFANDAATSVGETFLTVQPIPGARDRDPLFTPDDWHKFFVNVDTPPDAVFAQITWRWESGSDPGEINGIMYFDDSVMMGPPAANPDLTPAPVQIDTPTPSPSPQ